MTVFKYVTCIWDVLLHYEFRKKWLNVRSCKRKSY